MVSIEFEIPDHLHTEDEVLEYAAQVARGASKRARLDLQGGLISIWFGKDGGVEARTERAVGEVSPNVQIRGRRSHALSLDA